MGPSVSRLSRADRFEAFRRSPLGLVTISAICGLGLAVSGVTLVRAADDAGVLESIRNEAIRRAVRSATMRHDPGPAWSRSRAAPSDFTVMPGGFGAPSGDYPSRYASEGGGQNRKPAVRRARVALSKLGDEIQARRSLCVRTCDGFAFPLGTLHSNADLPAHKQACAASCPGAPTSLYTLAPGRTLEQTALARSVADGTPYGRLSTAFLFQKSRVAGCSCQGPDNVAQRVPILLDPTLRAGDVVVDRKGDAQVFAGSPKLPHSSRAFADYRRSGAIGRTARAQIDRTMGTSQKEAAARSFQRTIAVREAAAVQRGPLRYASLREVAAPAGSAANVRTFAYAPAGGAPSASAPRIIEIR